MLILAGTILILIGACVIAAGLHEKEKEGENPKKEQEG